MPDVCAGCRGATEKLQMIAGHMCRMSAGDGKIGLNCRKNGATIGSSVFRLWRDKNMPAKKYTKEQALKIVTTCAREYDKALKNHRFLLAYMEGDVLKYTIVLFRTHNYLHLTGLKIPYITVGTERKPKFNSKEFYNKCLTSRLSVNDFEFDEVGNCHLKLSVLHMVPTMFYNHNLIGDFLRIGQYVEADYFIGMPNKDVSLGFRSQPLNYDYPVTLYKQDIKQLTTATHKIIGIWRLDYDRSVVTYLAKEQNEAELTKQLLTIGAPIKVLVTV